MRCWLKTDRPRERIVREGVSGLSDAELVALILRTGDGVLDVVAFARSLLLDFGSLTALVDAQPQALFARRGLGGAKVAALLAVRGVLERYHAEVVRDRKVISGSNATRRYLRQRLAHRQREVFGGLFLDTRHRLIACEELFFGSVDRAAVYPREVLRTCLQHNASAVILFHNHPSGVAEPSAQDITLTSRLATLLREVDVVLLDHVVVGGKEQVSMAERGLICA
ncbi:MAG: DNA repair protein RadC [Gammaproteobacteria bacterium]|nr:DNA repair protein RadC [Gammaproteobacteria bacterium]